MESQESRYKQTEAQLRYAQTSVDLAKEKEKKAEVSLAIARKDLRDALVFAPITGKVSQKIRESGEMAQPWPAGAQDRRPGYDRGLSLSACRVL